MTWPWIDGIRHLTEIELELKEAVLRLETRVKAEGGERRGGDEREGEANSVTYREEREALLEKVKAVEEENEALKLKVGRLEIEARLKPSSGREGKLRSKTRR